MNVISTNYTLIFYNLRIFRFIIDMVSHKYFKRSNRLTSSIFKLKYLFSPNEENYLTLFISWKINSRSLKERVKMFYGKVCQCLKMGLT